MLNRPSERADAVLAECCKEGYEGACSLVHCDLQQFDSVKAVS